ncbi:MAG: TfoX/Sxy family protein [Nitrospirae bacterium]|nr:TfoX/Sxy family protein [Candidatus Manganitrophaceae bacterium]
MAKRYLVNLAQLIERTGLVDHYDIKFECKHFFSGAALYVDERICLSLTPLGLALKLPEKTRANLFENKTAIPLRYFPKGPIKKDYVLFQNDLKTTEHIFYPYMLESVRYVLGLPNTKKGNSVVPK